MRVFPDDTHRANDVVDVRRLGAFHRRQQISCGLLQRISPTHGCTFAGLVGIGTQTAKAANSNL